jgi:RNA polymerase sigma-70 factor (ECF subfamily)
LYAYQPSPVVRLNEMVALSFAEGPEAGLTGLARLEGIERLEFYQPYWAARADLLRRAGRNPEAAECYRRAIELTQSAIERQFLTERLQSMTP